MTPPAASSKEVETTSKPERLSDRISDDRRVFFLNFEAGGAFYRSLPAGTRVDVITVLRKEVEMLTPMQNAEVLEVFPHPHTGTRGAAVALAAQRGEERFLELSRREASTSLMVRRESDKAVAPTRRYTPKRLLEELELFHHERKRRRDDARGTQESKAGLALTERIPEDEYAVFVESSIPPSAVSRGDRVDLTGIYRKGGVVRWGYSDDSDDGTLGLDLVQAAEVLDVIPAEKTDSGDSAMPGGLVVALSRAEAHLVRMTEYSGRIDMSLRPSDTLETHSVQSKTLEATIHDIFYEGRALGCRR